MAISNEQIIFSARVRLLAEGKLTTTGRQIDVINGQGESIAIEEPEELHTYKQWQALGQQVKRGEKAIARLVIWQRTGRPRHDSDDSENPIIRIDEGHFFRKESCFFAAHQVEPVTT